MNLKDHPVLGQPYGANRDRPTTDLTKREFVAALIFAQMTSLPQDTYEGKNFREQERARWAVTRADALFVELEKKP